MRIVLASSSPIRRAMLEAAGVAHDAVPPGIDETAAKAGGGEPSDLAVKLATAKAVAVSEARREDWVIGSDSLVTVDGRMFDKPATRAQAEEHLRFFSDRSLQLTSAVALACRGAVDWSICDTATLEVRELSDDFIHAYLEREWPEVANCVGVFRLEGPGVQLFERIEGDHFTILGMPLVPLLGALRERGLLLA